MSNPLGPRTSVLYCTNPGSHPMSVRLAAKCSKQRLVWPWVRLNSAAETTEQPQTPGRCRKKTRSSCLFLPPVPAADFCASRNGGSGHQSETLAASLAVLTNPPSHPSCTNGSSLGGWAVSEHEDSPHDVKYHSIPVKSCAWQDRNHRGAHHKAPHSMNRDLETYRLPN